MKKLIFTLTLLGLLLAPPYMAMDSSIETLSGDPILEGTYLAIKSGKTKKFESIKTGDASGILVCWESRSWETGRAVGIAIEGHPEKPVLLSRQVSHNHTCGEIHLDFARYAIMKRFRREITFEKLPDPITISITVNDKKPLKMPTSNDGTLKRWLIYQSKIGDDPIKNLGSLIERGSHYKPVTPLTGYLLFVLWFPFALWTLSGAMALGREPDRPSDPPVESKPE